MFDDYDKCKLCGKQLCLHGSLYCVGTTVTCSHCKEVGEGQAPETYCLPMYEGKVDFTSKTYVNVCKECHEKYNTAER